MVKRAAKTRAVPPPKENRPAPKAFRVKTFFFLLRLGLLVSGFWYLWFVIGMEFGLIASGSVYPPYIGASFSKNIDNVITMILFFIWDDQLPFGRS